MEAAEVHVGNWGSVRQFQHAQAEAGIHHFPTISTELPNVNGGHTDSEAARHFLVELQEFEASAVTWDVPTLVDAQSGSIVAVRIEAHDGVFLWVSGVRAALDDAGRFVVRNDDGVLFSAVTFNQRVLAGPDATGGALVELEDEDGQTLTTAASLRVERGRSATGRSLFHYPRQLRVESRRTGTERSQDVVDALRTIMTASIEIGNPVHWT
jgi:hypothetical protein